MEFTSPAGEQRYSALVRSAARSVVGLDFDGTLAPITDDPAAARIHPDAPAVLTGLAEQVLAVAVITGRPVQQVLDLGGLDEVGRGVEARGRRQGARLHVFGQYGNERWSSTSGRVVRPPAPAGLGPLRRELADVLRRVDAADAYVEDKGLGLAVHTRRLDDPGTAFDRLLPALRDLAARHGLHVEPGRAVVEVRALGTHKGTAVHTIVDELDAGGCCFAGDDLGDLEAFDAVAELAAGGMPTLRVCSSSEEEAALVERSDVVVSGPDGVLDLLRALTEDAARAH